MKLEVTDVIAYPVDVVFAAFRDNLSELAEYLEAIERINVLSRETDGDTMHVVSIWESKIKFPGPVEKIIPQGVRSYRDVAAWHADRHCVEWRIEIPVLTEAIDAHGINTFVAKGDKTEMSIRGEINIDAGKIKGVPSFLARSVVPTITKFVVSTVKKNMVAGNRGMERFLAGRRG